MSKYWREYTEQGLGKKESTEADFFPSRLTLYPGRAAMTSQPTETECLPLEVSALWSHEASYFKYQVKYL